MMERVSTINRLFRPLGALLVAMLLAVLGGCGGGGSGGTSPNTPTGTLGMSPSAITIEFGAAPVTIIISGGVKPYALTSSQQALIPVINSVAEDGPFTIPPALAPALQAGVALTVPPSAQGTPT